MSDQATHLFPTVVVGAGAWATALAVAVARNGHDVLLWARDAKHAASMQAQKSNERYLPGLPFPDTLAVATDFTSALGAAAHVLVVVPSGAFTDVLINIKPYIAKGMPISWATKGLVPKTGQFLSDIAATIIGDSHPLAIISGPSFANEVAKNLPTAITVASQDDWFNQTLAAAIHSPTLRAYTTRDTLGVQIGGAVKNVLAISAGIADGLGYGANARAALITRGMTEMLRLAVSLGAQTETIFGLSGVGDVILTCTDDQSRNRQLGLAIGGGMTAEQAVSEAETVEGISSAREVLRRAQQADIEMPIVEQVCNILFNGHNPQIAVKALLCRQQKPEAAQYKE